MNQEDHGPAGRRSQRPRSGLAIFDETLLFELHAEMMQKEEVTKRPRSNLTRPGPRPVSSDNGGHPINGDGDNSDDQRAIKRPRSGASSGTPRGGGTSADDDYGYAEEDASHARTAWATGLNIEGLSEDEINAGLLPPEANLNEYALVRNKVLGMWRKDVSKKLLVKDVLDAVKPRQRAYALAAWQFLNAMGYINFGVSPEIQSDVDSTPDTRGAVIVVGAGCAGLSTARQLRSWGYRVIVVEGRNRPGGRVFTSRLSATNLKNSHNNGENTGANTSNTNDITSSTSHAVVADVGGSIITGIDGNPLAVLTKQLKIPLAHIRDRAPIFMPDGTPANDALDSAVEQYYNHSLMKGCNVLRARPETVENMSLQGALEKLWSERYGELERLLPEVRVSGGGDIIGSSGNSNSGKKSSSHPDGGGTTMTNMKLAQYPLLHPTARKARQLFEWHLANLEFANACKLDTCSLLHWDQDDPFELPGAHCFVPGCNGRWVQALAKGIPILYNHPVSEVRYCKTGVAVHTANSKVLHADAVVVTAPLGVLKRGGIAFNPPLSEHKRGSIARLGFGNLNKVILMFPKVFWGEDEDMFGHVSEDPACRGEAFLFYSYAHISGGAQLTALIAGLAAEEHEKRSVHDSVTRVMDILRSIFEPKGIVVPPPLQALITRWGSDPMAYGAYSSLPVGSHGGEDYDIMAKSVGGRLFFAGEATTRRYPATMHGAFFTGLWAAADVDAALSKAKNVPQFSNKVSAEVVEAITKAEEEKAAAVAAANLAAAAKKLPRPPSNLGGVAVSSGYNPSFNGNHGGLKPTSPEEQASLDKLVNEKLVSSRLKMLFDDPQHPPDLEVGSFKAVYGAPGSHVAHQALLHIEITSARGKFSKEEEDGTRQVNLYCVVLKDTAMAVAEQVDNYARVALLRSLPSVKLVERTGLGPDALSVMDSVMRWRRKKEIMPNSTAAAMPAVPALTADAKNAFEAVLGASGGAVFAVTPIPPSCTFPAAAMNAVKMTAAGSAFNTYFPPQTAPQPQIKQQQQQQAPMFSAPPPPPPPPTTGVAGTATPSTGGNGIASTAVPDGLGLVQHQQQQYPQQHQVEIRNEESAPPAPAVVVQKVEEEAVVEAPPAAPAPAPAPPRPPSGFSALDIALGLAISDITDLTGDD